MGNGTHGIAGNVKALINANSIIEKHNAIQAWRDLMGPTNPANAGEVTLRKLYGTDIGCNATHGSDAPETAAHEIKFFFPELS